MSSTKTLQETPAACSPQLTSPFCHPKVVMFVLGRALLKQTSRHCKSTLFARIAPVSYSSFQDQVKKDPKDYTLSLRAMVTNTRKSSRNNAASAGPNAMEIDAGNQARSHTAILGCFTVDSGKFDL
jgi:hypothetical protein